MISIWRSALLVAILCAKGAAAVPLTDAAAKQILEAEHAANSIFKLIVGNFAVVGSTATYQGADAITELKSQELRAWSRVGVIEGENDPAWEAFIAGKGDARFYNQRKQGVIARIRVTPTAMAAPYRDRKNPRQYNIPMGNLVIARIEQNLEKKIGKDDYRVITFDGRIEFLPITAEYFKQFFIKSLKAENRVIKQECRAIYLMKYNPASRGWERIVADWADESGKFQTKDVDAKLAELAQASK